MKLNPADLRRVSVFNDATDDDLELFAEKGTLRTMEEGEFFFFQGDPASHMYVLVSGRAKLVQSSPTGQQVILRTINEWQTFGALGVVRPNATYPVTAQALIASAALAIESELMKAMLPTRPYLNLGLMQIMTNHITEMQERFREMATERVERRIARTVLRLASQIGKRVAEDKPFVELPLSRQEIAEAAGASIFTVSRALAEWERQGVIEAGRERVVIKNPHKLLQISEGAEE